MLDRLGRIEPCGGAIPPRLIADFDIPDSQLVGRATMARMVGPSQRTVDMPIEGGFVGMVDRGPFDEFLRERAAKAGRNARRGRSSGSSIWTMAARWCATARGAAATRCACARSW